MADSETTHPLAHRRLPGAGRARLHGGHDPAAVRHAAAVAVQRGRAGSRVFVGLDNFRTLFGDPRWSASFWNALCNNIWFFIIHMLVQNPIGIALAALLSSPKLRFSAFYRTAIFIPTILSFVIVGFVWKLILSPLWGVAPNLLDIVGLKSLFAPWLGKEEYALTTLGADLGLAVRRHPDDADLRRAAVDPRRGDRGRRMRRHHRLAPVLEDQAAADPAGDRHHLDPHLRRQFQRLRPDLLGAGRARRAELLDRHPRHLPLPHLLRLPAADRRPEHGRDHRLDDVLHHPGRRLRSISSPSRRACVGTSSEGAR